MTLQQRVERNGGERRGLEPHTAARPTLVTGLDRIARTDASNFPIDIPPAAHSRKSASRKNRGRTVTVVVTVLGLLAVAAGGWFAAIRFESPGQRAAAAAAPSALPVTATVARGALADQITATASIRNASPTSVVVSAGSGTSVVTAQPLASGVSVTSGQMLLSVNDRPRFAVQGGFVAYRDLVPGDQGRDVRQLQDALRAAGSTIPAAENDTFGAATEAAITKMYKKAGVAALTTEDGAHPIMPAAELMVFPVLPAILVASPSVGTVLTDTTTVTVGAADLVASAEIAASVVGRVSTDTMGTLTDEAGRVLPVQVSGITPGDEKAGTPANIEVRPTGEPIPPEWAGAPVLLALDLQVAASDALLVPSRAVTEDSTGAQHVTVRTSDGSLEVIEVVEIGVLGGQSAIEPVVADTLVEGDEVRVDP